MSSRLGKRKAELVLLIEDRAHDSFVRQFLNRMNFNSRQIRPIPLVRGQGSAVAAVLRQYAEQVSALRGRTVQSAGLIVMIDADNVQVLERHRQLDQELLDAEMEPRHANEAICLLIPRRNIETWVSYLLNREDEVDESSNYKGNVKRQDIRVAGSDFADLVRHGQLASDAPSSLSRGVKEARERLPRKPK